MRIQEVTKRIQRIIELDSCRNNSVINNHITSIPRRTKIEKSDASLQLLGNGIGLGMCTSGHAATATTTGCCIMSTRNRKPAQEQIIV